MTFLEFQNKIRALQGAYAGKINSYRTKRSYGLFCDEFHELFAYRALKFLTCTTEEEFDGTCECVSQKDILSILKKVSERLC
jgi:hypothetical protein